MKVALITPQRATWSQNPEVRRALEDLREFIQPWSSANLGLLTVAALTHCSATFDYLDEQFRSIDYEADYDLVAISVMTQQAPQAYRIADRFRAVGRYVVMGGIHATLLPEEAGRHADTVIVGEAEALWPEFISDFSSGKPKRLYRTTSLCDLSESPIPRYDLLTSDGRRRSGYFDMVPVQTTRGCPHDCSFCAASNVFGRRYRTKQTDQVVREIQFLQSSTRAPVVLFSDDNLFVDKRFSFELMEALEPMNLRWVCQSDISVGRDKDLLKKIKRAGCIAVLIGLESLSETNLEHVAESGWKFRHLSLYEEYLHRIQTSGIIPYAAFIAGFDSDDLDTFTTIRDFMIKNHLLGQFTVLTPLPGTRLMAELSQEGRLLYKDQWDMYTFFDVVFTPKNMGPAELEKGLIWLYREIYNKSAHADRTKYMKRILKGIIEEEGILSF